MASYALLTWICDKCPAMPIMNFRGMPGSGKTRAGDILRRICYRGMRASGSLSFSALFRNADAWKGTIFINEGDLKDSSDTAYIIKFLNERYDKEGNVWRTNPETMGNDCFDAYGPTILTSRREFMDNALESRCITIMMAEKSRKDIYLNLPAEYYSEAQELRNKCLMFRFRNLQRFENDYKLEFDNVGARTNQILQPLASLARGISQELSDLIRGFATELQDRIAEESSQSGEGIIIRAFLQMQQVSGEISSTEVSKLVWELGGESGPIVVGRTLKHLGLEQKKSSDGKTRFWVISPSLREVLIRKYVPREERDALRTDTLNTIDRFGEGGAVAPPSLEETVRFIKGIIGAWDGLANESGRLDVEYLERRSEGRYPRIRNVALKLIQNGHILRKPNGDLALPKEEVVQ